MRNHQSIIKQAMLMASPAQEVVAYLKERAAHKDDIRFEKAADEELELALLSRQEPLINLALAQYAAYSKTIRALFEQSKGNDESSKALRYCLLTNQTAGRLLDDLPGAFFEAPLAQLDYFKNVDADELYVLFQNPKLSDSFLRDFYEGDEYWQALSEEKRLATLDGLIYNERMVTPYDNSYLDGYSEYIYNAVFDAVWKLAESAPVNPLWASRLSLIYRQMIGRSHSDNDPLTVAKRWRIDPSDTEAIDREKEDNGHGYLSDYQGVRKGLARLALSRSSDLINEFWQNSDVAYRTAVYSSSRLSAEQIAAGYDKDGELFFNEAIHNERLWIEEATRDALSQVAWSVVNADEHSDLMPVNILNRILDDMAKKHPAWFIGDDYEDVASNDDMNAPATKADLNQIALSITKVTNDLIQGISKRVDWIWLFALGALVATLLKK